VSDLTSSEKSADRLVTNPLTRSASAKSALLRSCTAQTKSGALPDGSGMKWWRSCFEKLISFSHLVFKIAAAHVPM
jgi:hypothetical protein